MKTLTTTMIAVTLLVASATAMANSSSETVLTPIAPTKAAAYEQGVNKLSALKNSSPSQLRRSLKTPFGDIESDSLSVQDGGYVTVQERADVNGKVGYVGIVNVKVNFEMHDSDK
jgi:hypothetical protein